MIEINGVYNLPVLCFEKYTIYDPNIRQFDFFLLLYTLLGQIRQIPNCKKEVEAKVESINSYTYSDT